MEDRYLYRAKKIDNWEWVEGLLTIMWGQFHIINPNDENTAYPIYQSTICQCTGLKDKDGKLIYENDIAEMYDRNTDYRWRAVVLFGNPNCEYTWGWQLKPIGECEANTDILCWIDVEESGAFCEVISPAFDNPELLEVEE